jgi:hypothetical protein
MDVFDRLLKCFSGAREAAERLATPNSEDDFDIKMAIVGFSYHQAAKRWSRTHYEFIRARCEGELSNNALHDHGEAVVVWRAFACLALGARLGLHDSEKIDEIGFSLGDAQLPGFMFAYSPAIGHLVSL